MPPPLPPLVANTYETGNVASATSNSAASCNASVANFADEFLASLPESSAGGNVNFLGEGSTADDTGFTTPTSRPLFEVPSPFLPVGDDDSPE
jgi:hypothetical protein